MDVGGGGAAGRAPKPEGGGSDGGPKSASGQGGGTAENSITVKRKLEPVFSVDTYDKDTGTIWIHRRWVYTFSNRAGPLAGVQINENIRLDNGTDYKNFPR
jgi:hypothetical protein